MNPLLRAPLVLSAVAVTAAFFYRKWLWAHPAHGAALEQAGNVPLPSSRLAPDGAQVLEFVRQVGQAGPEYAEFLRWDDGLVALLLASFLCIAWLLARTSLRGWALAVAAFALPGAAADFGENALLRGVLGGATALAPWAAAATTAKSILLGAASGLALLGLLRSVGSLRAWWAALFEDVPHVLDSVLRRAEWLASREFVYTPAQNGAPARSEPRRSWKRPYFVFFCVVLFFVAFGPTLDGLCTLLPRSASWLVPVAVAAALLALVIRLFAGIFGTFRRSIDRFFDTLGRGAPQADRGILDGRKNVTAVALLGSAALLLVPSIYVAAGDALAGPAAELNFCASAGGFSWRSLARLGVWIAAILGFAWACERTAATPALVRLQALIAALAAALLWFALATPEAREADALPYRHVFGALAPALIVSLALAPWAAAAAFRPPLWVQRLRALGATGVQRGTRSFFRFLLTRRELFTQRGKAQHPAVSRVLFALLQGITYRVLQLVLPPALLAFVSPSEWVEELALAGLAFAVFASIWGNLSRRWRFVTDLVDRWFLAGAAFFVSLFVVVIAALRLYGVDYVTTILDATQAGVLLMIVVMSYVLSWLVEYWINRVVAVELLAVLGGDRAEPRMPYRIGFAPVTAIRVAREGRELGYHGLGRFLVVGTLLPGHQPVAGAPGGAAAFHSYELLELFRTLAGRDSDRVAEVIRASSLYFFAMNFVLLAVFAAAGAVYWHYSRAEPEAVVTASAEAPPAGLKDLAAALAQPADQPAIVVVGSGGGTRAALYTSHVLQGLHELDRDRDIVLVSGVSGGGVALAYFTAWHARLTQSSAPAAPVWKSFRDDVAGDLIGDVVAGASEWRIFGRAPLSILLAESFERHLLKGLKTSIELTGAPALILNTTIAGHPVEDSEILMQTLDRPGPVDCDEAARPYNMMHGGRLVFTNLKSTRAFPAGRPPFPVEKSTLANTRLPYVVVKDINVSLARAAALNANFPPVFPNALVRVRGALPGAPCPDRSYFVTDGGALENLGLVSALYAVQSALLDHLETCKASPGGCRLRPLHFVIAEASAAGYDYRQDRGVSAGIGGAKERMTGELTKALLADVTKTYESLGAEVRVHYLPLPLTFRARGGFGTHWMHDPSIDVTDPRPRAAAGGALRSASLDKEEVDKLWLALHDTRTPFCATSGSITYDKVKRWICGAPGDPDAPRDLHVVNWQELIRQLR